VVSATIIVERQEEGHAYHVQRPVYFVSEVLSKSNACYPSVQKLLYAVLINSRKLCHYFDEYKISVVTNYLGYLLLGIGVQNTDIHYLRERKKARIHTIVFGKRTKQFVVHLLVITHVSQLQLGILTLMGMSSFNIRFFIHIAKYKYYRSINWLKKSKPFTSMQFTLFDFAFI
jgi:hypothetical protein